MTEFELNKRTSASPESIPYGMVLNTRVNALGWNEVVDKVSDWVVNGESRCVCLCNVHSTVTAQSDVEFASVLSQSDLVLPDGMPIAWVLRSRGFKNQPRISGPDLMWKCAEKFEFLQQSVFLYGSTEESLEKLKLVMNKAFPHLEIAGAVSPPFRTLSSEEEVDIVATINGSGAHALFVALGCPKQEQWMLDNRGIINAVMFGFGAAFDFHAGNIRRAPKWMQRSGLEWLHRLASEPGRLWRRYLVTNTKFLFSILFRRHQA
ncbi:MAG: WecB/TagA/CpsF family glycosyltransferase [Methylococcales bacterium]